MHLGEGLAPQYSEATTLLEGMAQLKISVMKRNRKHSYSLLFPNSMLFVRVFRVKLCCKQSHPETATFCLIVINAFWRKL